MASGITGGDRVIHVVGETNDLVEKSQEIIDRLDSANTKISSIASVLDSNVSRLENLDYNIDATLIGNNDVSNAELGFYSTVSSNLQTQISNLASLLNSWRSGGIVTSDRINAAAIADGNVSNDDYSYAGNTTTHVQTEIDSISTDVASNSGADLRFPATIIYSGNISNAEFEAMNGLTEDVKVQLDTIHARIQSFANISGTNLTVQTSSLSTSFTTTIWNRLGTLEFLGYTFYPDVQTSLTGIHSNVNSIGSYHSNNAVNVIPTDRIADGSITETEFGYVNGVSSNIQNQLNSIDAKIRSVGTVSGNTVTVFPSSIGSGNVSGEEWQNTQTLSASFQDTINDISNNISSLGTLSGNNLIISAEKIADGSISNTVFGYVDGVTSNFQDQMNTFVSRFDALTTTHSNGEVSVSASVFGDGSVSNTEFDYLDGVTSNIKVQIDGKILNKTESFNVSVKTDYENQILSGTRTTEGTLSGPRSDSIVSAASDGIKTYALSSQVSTIYELDTENQTTTNTVYSVANSTANKKNIMWDDYRKRWIIMWSGGSGNIVARNHINSDNITISVGGTSLTDMHIETATILFGTLFYWSSNNQLTMRRFVGNSLLTPENINLYNSAGTQLTNNLSGKLAPTRNHLGLFWVKEHGTRNIVRANWDSADEIFEAITMTGTGATDPKAVFSTDENSYAIEEISSDYTLLEYEYTSSSDSNVAGYKMYALSKPTSGDTEARYYLGGDYNPNMYNGTGAHPAVLATEIAISHANTSINANVGQSINLLAPTVSNSIGSYSIEALNMPSGLSLSNAGRVNGMVSLGTPTGRSRIILVATDELQRHDSTSIFLNYTNEFPVVDLEIPNQELEVGSSRTINLLDHFSDPQESVSFSANSSATSNATIDVNSFTLTIEGESSGLANVTVTATDQAEQSISDTFLVTVVQPPIISSAIANILVSISGILYVTPNNINLNNVFTDSLGNALQFAATTSNDSIANISVSGNTLRFTIGEKGIATINVTATSTSDLSTTDTFTVTVPNRSPRTINPIPNQSLVRAYGANRPDPTVVIDLEESESNVFDDPDDDTMSYSVSSSSSTKARATISGSNVTVAGLLASNVTVTAGAFDGSLSASDPFNVATTVNGPIYVTNLGLYSRIFRDEDQELTYSWSDANTIVERDSNRNYRPFAVPDGDPITYGIETALIGTQMTSASIVKSSSNIVTITLVGGTRPSANTCLFYVTPANPSVPDSPGLLVNVIHYIDNIDDIKTEQNNFINLFNDEDILYYHWNDEAGEEQYRLESDWPENSWQPRTIASPGGTYVHPDHRRVYVNDTWYRVNAEAWGATATNREEIKLTGGFDTPTRSSSPVELELPENFSVGSSTSIDITSHFPNSDYGDTYTLWTVYGIDSINDYGRGFPTERGPVWPVEDENEYTPSGAGHTRNVGLEYSITDIQGTKELTVTVTDNGLDVPSNVDHNEVYLYAVVVAINNTYWPDPDYIGILVRISEAS